MNLQITEQHKELIQLCQQNGLRYLIRDDYPWRDSSKNEPLPSQQLQLWVQGGSNPNEDKFQSKILADGFKASSYWNAWVKIRTAGWGELIDMDFLQAYQKRIIHNHQGQSLCFYPSESVADLAAAYAPQVSLDYDDNLRIINAMNFFQVQYLLIDSYPISDPIGGDPNDTRSMRVWVNPTEDNAKNFRKASTVFSGNPPSVKEMCRDRRYRQGLTYFQTFYQGVSFDEYYQSRLLLNHRGVEVAFARR